MAKRTDIKKILIIGSGPIVIGQAAEFDYAGTQACLALKEEGYEVVLCNSNPATIMTDTTIADKVYMEPLTLEYIAKILRYERPDAIVPGIGGQTGLNLAMQLEAQLLELGIPSVILRLGDLVEDWRKILAVSPSVIFVLDGGCRAVAHVNPPCVTPMIFVDCDNDDPLYYKILPDYPSLMGEAKTRLGREDLFLVAEPVRSGQLMTLLSQGFAPQDVFFHDGTQSLSAFLEAHQGRKGVVVGDLLGVEVCGQFPPEDLAVICSLDDPGLFPPQTTLLPAPNADKAKAAAALFVIKAVIILEIK